jgi:hypothetical protein
MDRRTLPRQRRQDTGPATDTSLLLVGTEEGEAVTLEGEDAGEGPGARVVHDADLGGTVPGPGLGPEDGQTTERAGRRQRRAGASARPPGSVAEAALDRSVGAGAVASAGSRRTSSSARHPIGTPPNDRRQPFFAGATAEWPARNGQRRSERKERSDDTERVRVRAQGQDPDDKARRHHRDLTATPPRDQASSLERPEPVLGVSPHRGRGRRLRSARAGAT